MAPPTSVVVIEAIPFTRLGISTALRGSCYDVVGHAGFHEIEAAIDRYGPDIVIAGADLLKDGQAECVLSIAKLGEPILILLAEGAEAAQFLIASGPMGLLDRRAEPEELLACLEEITKGNRYISPSLLDGIDSSQERPNTAHRQLNISWREYQVVRLVEVGLSDREIGERLGVATSTVNSHMKAIRRKFGVKTRTQVALISKESSNRRNFD